MKILHYLALFLTLVLGGCQDTPDLSTKPASTNEFKWVELPANKNMSVESEFSIEKIINGETGGEMLFESAYPGGPHGNVTIYAKIVFPPNAFTGDKNITLSINNDYTILTFSPSMVFNTPAILNVTFSGLDLTGINPANVDFVYESDDGIKEVIGRTKLKVISGIGTLDLENGVVPHFSRLGFTR